MIIMPSLTALAGRAGYWDRAFMSAAELRTGTLLELCTAPNNPEDRETTSLLLQLEHEWKESPGKGGKM